MPETHEEVRGKRSRGSWILLPVVLGLTVLVLVSLWIVGPRQLLQRLVVSLSEDTEYSTGFSEEAFRSIQLGEAETHVNSTLGVPLEERVTEPYKEWLYTADANAEFASSGVIQEPVSYTVLSFDEQGYFQGARGQISHGTATSGLTISSSGSFGDGQNFLRLTNAEIAKLQAAKATQADLQVRFGAPRETFTSHVTRWFRYSRSPGSTHYYIRMIGLDASGAVVRKRSEIYWD